MRSREKGRSGNGRPDAVADAEQHAPGTPDRLACSSSSGVPAFADPASYDVWRAASSITFVTSPGWEISDRCEALISVTVACARRAMNSCAAGGIAWSAVPITAQLGMLVQAGGPDTSASAEAAIGRWVAASSAAWLRRQVVGEDAAEQRGLDVHVGNAAGGRDEVQGSPA